MKVDLSIWGFGLFGSFVVFMLFLVYFASIQKVDLTTETYYEEELDFIEVQTQVERSKQAEMGIDVSLSEREYLLIQFTYPTQPKETELGEIYGTLHFYKPNAKEHDKTLNFKTDTETYKLNIGDFISGYYKLKVEWAPIDTALSDGYVALTEIYLPR